jgi:hypothetical protein
VPQGQLQEFYIDIIAAGYDVGGIFYNPMPAYLLESSIYQYSILRNREPRMIIVITAILEAIG